MQAPTDQFVKQAEQILANNNEKANITIKSFPYKNSTIYFLHFDVISSTMLLSEKWNYENLDNGDSFVFSASMQTQGRGQGSNKWDSPLSNVMMTILTKSPTEIVRFIYLSCVNCIAEVCEKAVDLVDPIKFKWVNDLMINDEKFSGILVITSTVGNDSYLQLGIGINANVATAAASTSLKKHTKTQQEIPPQKVTEIIEKLTIKVLDCLGTLPDSHKELLEKYNSKLEFKGEIVDIWDFKLENVLHTGKFVRLSEYGFAVIEKQVNSGKMRKAK